jgi:hypothetical protein
VYALDTATGATRWTAETGTPYPPKHLGLAGSRLGVIYVGSSGDRRHAFPSAGCGAATCRPLWTVEFNPDPFVDQVHFPPAVSRGAVYATGTVSLVARFSVP